MTHCKMVFSAYGDIAVIWRNTDAGPSIVRILLPGAHKKREKISRQHGLGFHEKTAPSINDFCASIDRCLQGFPVALPLALLDTGACGEFQQKVLFADHEIPRGRVSSYSGLARKIGAPHAARAVGTALARNPFPLIIPCHRVVRRDGSLGGFGGGLEMKRALLEMEGVCFDAEGRVGEEYFW